MLTDIQKLIQNERAACIVSWTDWTGNVNKKIIFFLNLLKINKSIGFIYRRGSVIAWQAATQSWEWDQYQDQ